MNTYKWKNPLEWLEDAIQTWSPNELKVEFIELAMRLDHDAIQDLYQSDMEKDGYFNKED